MHTWAKVVGGLLVMSGLVAAIVFLHRNNAKLATQAAALRARQVPVAQMAEENQRTRELLARATTDATDATQTMHQDVGFHLWSDNYDRELKDIFDLQDEIARDIAQNLQVKLGVRQRITRTVNPEAHRLVFEGRHFWHLRTEEGFRRSEAAFMHALAIDPEFAEARSGLAELCVSRATYRQWDGLTDVSADVERARAEARRAMEIDATLAEPCAALGLVFIFDHKLAESERQFQPALARNPNSALTHSWHGISLSCQGRIDAALGCFQKASELNPLWFTNLALYASRLFHARRYQEALEVNQRAQELRADVYMLNRSIQPQILAALGRMDEAVEAARFSRQRLELNPRWLADSIAVAVLRQAGLERDAADFAADLFARWPRESFNRGFVLGALGRFDEALPFLERSPYMPCWWLFWDPLWDQWRDDPRFLQLIAKLGRAEEYQVARATLARMLAERGAK